MRKNNALLRNTGKWLGVAILSAGVGSGVTAVALPHYAQIQNAIAATPTSSVPSYSPTSLSLQSTQSTGNAQIDDAVVQAVKKATPAVVGVLNLQVEPNASGVGSSLQDAAVGSGVIFSPLGYIVTNNHVVEGANQVQVVIDQSKKVVAKVIGTDPYTDLAVLKVPETDITMANVAQFGNSATLQAGQTAIAIGNPAGLAFSDTVTSGVISATSRTMPVQDEITGQTLGQETVLQTDAAINPGNSGGPLLNILGQVIGINSSKIVAQGFSGMGFAIPINEVHSIVNQILATGHAAHAALGIEGDSLADVPAQYQPNVPVHYGVWVYAAVSPSAKAAGLQRGDVIIAVNGTKITDVTGLQNLLAAKYKPAQEVSVTLYRGQKEMTMKIVLSNRPPLSLPANGGGTVVG